MEEAVKLWIVDDNVEFCSSLTAALQDYKWITSVRCFLSTQHALEALKAEDKPPTVIILDIVFPGASGLDAIRPIKEIYPTTRIIIVTGYNDEDNIRKALHEGASGFLLKPPTIVDVIGAIRSVQRGGVPMDPLTVAKLVTMTLPQTHTCEEYGLTQREQEVLKLLKKGLRLHDIARELSIGYEAIHSHSKNLHRKLGVTNYAELLAKIYKEGLIQ